MRTSPDTGNEALLVALGLSVEATRKIRTWQQERWRNGSDLLTIALPPLIPLAWTKAPAMPFERLDLPRMPRSETFDRHLEAGGACYLTAGSQAWQGLCTSLVRSLPIPDLHGVEVPFPSIPGILLGRDIDESAPHLAIENNDWRLLQIRCTWHIVAGKTVNFIHYIEIDRHLAVI